MIKIVNQATFTEILIYGKIGFWEITADVFAREIAEKHEAGTPLLVRINSNGGGLFDGIVIHNILKRIDNVTVHIDGIAASIASYIAMAGDKIIMADNAWMMIHNVHGETEGEAEDLRRDAKLMDTMTATLAAAYADKTGKTTEEIQALMDVTTWFTATEALALGLVDEIGVGIELAACAGGFGKHNFRNYAAMCGEKIDQPKTNTNKKGAQTMSSATYAEVKAACVGADNDFICAQLAKDATVENALKDHMKAQSEKVAASEQAATDAKAAQATAEEATKEAEAKAITDKDKGKKASGTPALGMGADGTDEKASSSEGEPVAQFDALVREKIKAGMVGSKACKAVACAYPELHAAYKAATSGEIKV